MAGRGFLRPVYGFLHNGILMGSALLLTVAVIFRNQPLKEQSCHKPKGQVVETDDFFDMPLGTAVIPWADIFFA